MISSKFTHITFAVKNIEESLNFYKEWFNLEVHLDRRPNGNTVWVATKDQNKKNVPEFVFVLHEGEITKINHFGFQIEERSDLDSLAIKAKEKGILLHGPEDIGGVVGSFLFIEDPNGHTWEFTVGQPLLGI
jgi:catechol 2,3-dioxygenase-like lactoylglutathione lyase family enzyme